MNRKEEEMRVNKITDTGKKYPECGTKGKWHGEHETAVRNVKLASVTVVDVGFRCWNCGHEWGFELLVG